jgi:hypothetical protein
MALVPSDKFCDTTTIMPLPSKFFPIFLSPLISDNIVWDSDRNHKPQKKRLN